MRMDWLSLPVLVTEKKKQKCSSFTNAFWSFEKAECALLDWTAKLDKIARSMDELSRDNDLIHLVLF